MKLTEALKSSATVISKITAAEIMAFLKAEFNMQHNPNENWTYKRLFN